MKGLLKFVAAALILGFIFFKLRTQQLDRPEGKLLGVVQDGEGFGAYEIVAGAVLAGGLFLGATALKMAKLGKFAPAAQGPLKAAA
jgi:hypothetical protein